MRYKEAVKYLTRGYIIHNTEYEYKANGEQIYCRHIGFEAWNSIYEIPEYEKLMDWNLIGKKE